MSGSDKLVWQQQGQQDGEAGRRSSLPWLSGDSEVVDAYTRGQQLGLQRRIARQLERANKEEESEPLFTWQPSEVEPSKEVLFQPSDVPRYVGDLDAIFAGWVDRMREALLIHDGGMMSLEFGCAHRSIPFSPLESSQNIKFVDSGHGFASFAFIRDLNAASEELSGYVSERQDVAYARREEQNRIIAVLLGVPTFGVLYWWNGWGFDIVALAIVAMGAACCFLVERAVLQVGLTLFGVSPSQLYRVRLKEAIAKVPALWEMKRKELLEKHAGPATVVPKAQQAGLRRKKKAP
jgi:hypothetical protein